jgi:hypothetical protein
MRARSRHAGRLDLHAASVIRVRRCLSLDLPQVIARLGDHAPCSDLNDRPDSHNQGLPPFALARKQALSPLIAPTEPRTGLGPAGDDPWR